uniref:Cytochrome P450 n=4 Tax=Photinus pyralis TaxID=7054 RepID=A0A1Y1JZK3_PHOPY
MYYFIIALGFLLIFIITLLWRQTDSRYIELINKIPGPPTLPVVGNTYEMFGPPEYVWRMFQENNKRYYPIYRLWNAHIASVELLCPEDIEVLLTNNENLEKSRIYEFLQVWLGTGLLTSKDTKWHYRRKLITPAFHFGILKNFSKTMIERSELLIQNLELECNKAKTLIEPIIGEFTLRTICETAMGTKLEENDARSKEYMTSIYNMGQVILERIKRPWLFVECFYYFTQLRKQENALIKILHKFTTDVIENRKVQFKNVDILSASIREKGDEPKRRLALLDLLLHFRNQGASIQDEGIREEVDTFTFEVIISNEFAID